MFFFNQVRQKNLFCMCVFQPGQIQKTKNKKNAFEFVCVFVVSSWVGYKKFIPVCRCYCFLAGLDKKFQFVCVYYSRVRYKNCIPVCVYLYVFSRVSYKKFIPVCMCFCFYSQVRQKIPVCMCVFQPGQIQKMHSSLCVFVCIQPGQFK